MEMIDGSFGSLAAFLESVMPSGPVRSLLTDGVVGGVGSVLVFLPQIVILFLFIALLEDSGYMARAAFLVDRMFRWCGLSGKSFIPMLSSFACAVPGIMATRTIEDRKLRLITIMVAPLMTCSARLPVYAIMIAAFVPSRSYLGLFNLQGLVLTTLYLLGIVTAVLVSFLLQKTVLKTQRGTFMMEMPSYKIPTLRSVLIRVFNRGRSFVVRAGTVIFAITIIVWALSYYPHSERVAEEHAHSIAEFNDAYLAAQAAGQSELEAMLDEFDPGQRAAVREYQRALNDKGSEFDLDLFHRTQTNRVGVDDETAWAMYRLRLAQLLHEQALLGKSNELAGTYMRDSYLARIGRAVEPLFRPLGWDWRISMAVLASFPAREVIVATLGTIYNLGTEVDAESTTLIDKLRRATWEAGPRMGRPVFGVAVALSIVVFFALCCQCGATLVTIRQEAGRWFYATFVFTYMTLTAYVASLVVYQLFSRLGY
jgi:ferrous iron transport protein B